MKNEPAARQCGLMHAYLYSTHRNRGCIQNAEKRFRHSSGLSPAGTSCGCAHFRRVSRLFCNCHVKKAFAGSCSGFDSKGSAGENGSHSDAGCMDAYYRRPHSCYVALYATGYRSIAVIEETGNALPEQPLPRIYSDTAQIPKPLSA